MRILFVGRDRKVLPRLALYVVTFGISRRVWLYRVNREVDGHEALGYPRRALVILLCLPAVGPLVVNFQTAGRVASMLGASENEERVRYGPAWLWGGLTMIPLLGNAAFIAWTQSRLNRFWAAERRHPERGVEVDDALVGDAAFLVEMRSAVRASYHPKSRFESGWRQRWMARSAQASLRRRSVREERVRVRAAGGSTPVLWWRRPRPARGGTLHVTCGRCRHAFEVLHDPLEPTPLLCPSCGAVELLPSLHDDPLAPPQAGAMAVLAVTCPACRKGFYTLAGKELLCPHCGRREAAPSAPQAPRPDGRPA
ncbi:MAG: FmdB family zinc ribbon protein [Thermoplasmatota archaeon]